MDLYGVEKRLSSAEAQLRASSISKKDKELLFKFETFLFAGNTSMLRVEKYLRVLRISAETLDKPLEDVTKEDIECFAAYLNRQDLRAWSKRDYLSFVRRFFKWMGMEAVVKDLRMPKGKGRIPNMLSRDEIYQIVRRTPHERDKAMIIGFWDSGCRLGEWFSNLRLGDFVFEDEITKDYVEISPGLFQEKRIKKRVCFVTVFGKTGARPVRLEESVPYIEGWINKHPLKGDPKALVWVDHAGRALFTSYDRVKDYIRKLCSDAGVSKHIVFYSFRHSRLTQLDDTIREAYLKGRHGTSQLKTYIHNHKL